jgi:hypothetical protein
LSRQKHTEGAVFGITNGPGHGSEGSNNGLKVIFEGDAAITEESCSEDLVLSIDEDDDEGCQFFILPSDSACHRILSIEI